MKNKEKNTLLMCYTNALDNTFAFQVIVKLHPTTPPPSPLVRESEIRENFICEIWNPGPWNPEYSSKNPESH